MRDNAGVLLSSHLLDDEDKLDDLKDDLGINFSSGTFICIVI